MEIQQVPGLDFEELGMVFGVVIPPKFQVPTFSKYDGLSCPKLHLRSYVRKIQPHTADRKLWSISSKKVWLALNQNGSISQREPIYTHGKTWLLLSIISINITLTWNRLECSCRICPWALMKGSRNMHSVVPQNLPSHIPQDLSRMIFILLKMAQGLYSQITSQGSQFKIRVLCCIKVFTYKWPQVLSNVLICS